MQTAVEVQGQIAIQRGDTAAAYMLRVHQRLSQYERWPERDRGQLCARVTKNLLMLLYAESGDGLHALQIDGRTSGQGAPFRPHRYQGRVAWYEHHAALWNGQVFDPFVSPTAVREAEYPKAFTGPVKIEKRYYSPESLAHMCV